MAPPIIYLYYLDRVEDALAAHEGEVVAQLDPAVAALHHGLHLGAVDHHALPLLYRLPRPLYRLSLYTPRSMDFLNSNSCQFNHEFYEFVLILILGHGHSFRAQQYSAIRLMVPPRDQQKIDPISRLNH